MSNFFANERVVIADAGRVVFFELVGLTGVVMEERRSPLWGFSIIAQFQKDGHWVRIYARPDELVSVETQHR